MMATSLLAPRKLAMRKIYEEFTYIIYSLLSYEFFFFDQEFLIYDDYPI
jgi:hypothetical protein